MRLKPVLAPRRPLSGFGPDGVRPAAASAAPSGDIELRTPGGRVYGITEAPTLWTPHGLYIVWGRSGRPLRRRIETFDDRDALERRRRQLVKLRLRHGYVEIRPVRSA